MKVESAKGMRDLIGKDALLQSQVEDKFKKVFESYGYFPLYTPAVESFELFKKKGAQGEAIKDEIYYFKDKANRELALRFEFTASLARVAATNQLKLPFKRYQIGEVYRYDRPQAKRYRAFTQADVDILGVKGLEAEIEIMMIIRDCFEVIGQKPKVIFNSRKLLNDILKNYAKGKEIEAMRILDKMDKLEKKEIKEMLEEKGIDSKVVELIEKNNPKEITQIVGQDSLGLKEINDFIELCKLNKLDFVEFDSRLARGFEYYTGIVFEIKLDTGPSVGGGGRFDKLIGIYGGQETPAIGLGFGVSRIFDILKEQNKEPEVKGLFLCGIGVESKKIISIAQSIRKEGITIEVDLIGKAITKNIEYAQSKGYNFVGIIGDNELKAKKIMIKNLSTGKQELVEMNGEEIKKVIEK